MCCLLFSRAQILYNWAIIIIGLKSCFIDSCGFSLHYFFINYTDKRPGVNSMWSTRMRKWLLLLIEGALSTWWFNLGCKTFIGLIIKRSERKTSGQTGGTQNDKRRKRIGKTNIIICSSICSRAAVLLFHPAVLYETHRGRTVSLSFFQSLCRTCSISVTSLISSRDSL